MAPTKRKYSCAPTVGARPTAVAIHPEVPHASPRNVFAVHIAEMDIHETTIRVRGTDQPDGGPDSYLREHGPTAEPPGVGNLCA